MPVELIRRLKVSNQVSSFANLSHFLSPLEQLTEGYSPE